MNFDHLILYPAFSSFGLFFVTHIVALRCLPDKFTSKVMTGAFMLGMGCDITLLVSEAKNFSNQLGPSAMIIWVLAAASSTVIYGLLVFHYVAWIFGMGEAAIRIKLLQLLSSFHSRSATLDEIYAAYNADSILGTRLERLVGSGHLRFDGHFYRMRNKILLLQIMVGRIIGRLLGLRV